MHWVKVLTLARHCYHFRIIYLTILDQVSEVLEQLALQIATLSIVLTELAIVCFRLDNVTTYAR